MYKIEHMKSKNDIKNCAGGENGGKGKIIKEAPLWFGEKRENTKKTNKSERNGLSKLWDEGKRKGRQKIRDRELYSGP